MTPDKLPDELKSGRVLVATAAEENIGLYTYPGMDDDYRIVTRSGTVTRGDGETVPQPPSGHWRYLTNSAGERIADGAELDEDDDEQDDATERFLSKPPSLTPGDEAVGEDESEEVEVEVLELAETDEDEKGRKSTATPAKFERVWQALEHEADDMLKSLTKKQKSDPPPSDDTDVPEEWACLDCGCNVRKLEHAHTTGSPVRHLCCPCAVKQGRTRSASLSSDGCRLKEGA